MKACMGGPLRAEEMRVVPVGQKRRHRCDESGKGDKEPSKGSDAWVSSSFVKMREVQLLGTMPIVASFSETI